MAPVGDIRAVAARIEHEATATADGAAHGRRLCRYQLPAGTAAADDRRLFPAGAGGTTWVTGNDGLVFTPRLRL